MTGDNRTPTSDNAILRHKSHTGQSTSTADSSLAGGVYNALPILPKWVGYLVTILLEIALTVGLALLKPYFPLANFPIPYVLIIMIVAYLFGEGPALVAFLLGLLCFINFFASSSSVRLHPHPATIHNWAQITAFLLGTTTVGFATLVMRRSRRRVEHLAVELKNTNTELSAILDISDIAIGTLQLDDLLSRVLTRLMAITRAHTGAILLKEGDLLRVRASVGMEGPSNHRTLPIGQGFAGTIAATGKPLYIKDAQTDQLTEYQFFKEQRIHSMLGVPLLAGNEIIGVLHIDWLEIRPGGDHELHILELAADRCAMAIVNAQLYEQAREAKRLSDALNDIDAAINSTIDIDTIMQRVVVDAAKAIGCETAAIATREDDYWIPKYVFRFPDDVIGKKFSDNEVPFIALAAQTLKPVAVNDCETDPRVDTDVQRKYGVRSVLLIPLVIKQESVGALFFNYHDTTHTFTDTEIDFASKLGTSVSLAMENAHLYDEREELLRREHHIAEVLQRAIIPDVSYNIPNCNIAVRYEPALKEAEVGGDFYDIFAIDNGIYGILIGDVAGKGLPAAIRVAAARHSIRSYAYIDPDPAKVLTLANNALCKDHGTGEMGMLTAFFAVLDVHSGTMIYANGGHETPLLLGVDGRIEEIVIPGQAIGVMGNYDYSSDVRTIRPGDIVVMVTDGITEARPDALSLFGLDGIKTYLTNNRQTSNEEIASGLFETAQAHGGGRLKDDAAIVVFGLSHTGSSDPTGN